MFLYLSKITKISDFFLPLNYLLKYQFLKNSDNLILMQKWILVYVFFIQIYAFVKQILIIGNIIYFLFANWLFFFINHLNQIILFPRRRFELIKYIVRSLIIIAIMIYITLIFFVKKKIEYIKFLPKAITIYFKKIKWLKYKNNHRFTKLANFWLVNINKINCKMLINISLSLRLRKI